MRRLTNADLAAVREIDRLAFPTDEQYDGDFWDRIPASDSLEADVVTDDEGSIVGWSLVDVSRQPIRIRSLSVHPAFRRRGFGGTLVSPLLARHRVETDLLVDGANTNAVKLYKRLGFCLAGPDPEMPGRRRMLWKPNEKWFPLKTERLLLREFSAADERDIHEYASDSLVTRYVPWGPNTPDVTRDVLQTWLTAQKHWPRDEVTLAIELQSERKLIGGFRLAIADKAARTADFGYVLNRNYWNRGYTTEAARAILQTLSRHCTCTGSGLPATRATPARGESSRSRHAARSAFRASRLSERRMAGFYLYALLDHEVSVT